MPVKNEWAVLSGFSGPVAETVSKRRWCFLTEFRMRTLSISGLLALSLLAALVCTLGDAIHVLTSTLSYPDPLWMGQASWVFPLFFMAFLAMALGGWLLIQSLPDAIVGEYGRQGGSWRGLMDQLLLFLLIYLLSGFGNHSPDLLLTIFSVTFFVRLALAQNRIFVLLLALLLAPGGMVAEGFLHEFGMVSYREPEWFNVPLWLGGLYAHGAFALRDGIRLLVFRPAPAETLV
ncbi:hypothetical protein ACQUQU_05725 [Thalassolituus sp. LLYu03]|uniref:hypothetical protein n=1 Tax=Thalassolituus sp. LLYu03 TaxID=3421656 RepID=UPI003D28B72D